MKYLLVLACMFLWFIGAGQNTQSPEQIRQEMARIRQTTNWDDPAAAKKANEQIRELSKKLMAGNQMPAGGVANQQQQGGNTSSKDAQKLNELNQEMLDQKMDIWTQIWKSAAGGEGADILLAEPLRKKIIDEFKQEDDQTLNPMFAEQLNVMVINLSMPGIESVIKAMPNFRGIKTLIIEAGDHPNMSLLFETMKNSKDYQLEFLSIINFRSMLVNLPDQAFRFNKLYGLYLYNNAIKTISPDIQNLSVLKELYIDMNPISNIISWISPLKNLEKIGVAKTAISQEDLDKVRIILPNCQILEK